MNVYLSIFDGRVFDLPNYLIGARAAKSRQQAGGASQKYNQEDF